MQNKCSYKAQREPFRYDVKDFGDFSDSSQVKCNILYMKTFSSTSRNQPFLHFDCGNSFDKDMVHVLFFIGTVPCLNVGM